MWEGIHGMRMQILLLAFFPAAHITVSGEEFTSGRTQAAEQMNLQIGCSGQSSGTGPSSLDSISWLQHSQHVTDHLNPVLLWTIIQARSLQPKAALTLLQESQKTDNTRSHVNGFVVYHLSMQAHNWWSTIKASVPVSQPMCTMGWNNGLQQCNTAANSKLN